MRALLYAVTLFTATAAHGQQIAYKGFPLGGEQSQLIAQFPSLACVKPPPQLAALGELHCTERSCSGDACRASETALSTYAGMPAWDVTFAVVGGRVEGFTLALHASSYEAVRDALREANGQGRESTQPMQTIGGARIAPRVWSTATPAGTITLFERARRIDDGALVVESKSFDAWRRARRPTGDI